VWNRIAPEVQDQIVEMALNSPSYHRANWRCDLPMNANTLCPKPRFTACSRPMI
jgi:hypothetical protein